MPRPGGGPLGWRRECRMPTMPSTTIRTPITPIAMTMFRISCSPSLPSQSRVSVLPVGPVAPPVLAWTTETGAAGWYLRICTGVLLCLLITSDTVRKFAPSLLYVIASPSGSPGSGVIRGVPVVTALTTSPLDTVHSYASE